MGQGKRSIGILSHVDAGKTTLSEGILYEAGAIRSLGRVDHRDAFLDTDEQERARGITIFSKQAIFNWRGRRVTLLDTPGHVDFSSETERVLGVLDAAVLVVSAADGVQGHTCTLWKLLERYGVPVFIFVNKMDLAGADKERVMGRLQEELSDGCVDFSRPHDAAWAEDAAMCDEELLDRFIDCGGLERTQVARVVGERKIFPCFFGSALQCTGIRELLDGMEDFLPEPAYGEEFGARVFKISRDEAGARLTWAKVTGGSLRVRGTLDTGADSQEKITQIRLYSGARYETVEEAAAGDVCALTGLAHTSAGDGLGAEKGARAPLLAPVMNYRLELPDGTDPFVFLGKLRQLEEEDPLLGVVWNERTREIHMQLMGEVQTEILRQLIWTRFHEEVSFAEGHIVYKETVAEPVEGVGHFEPLRHYAEVHLLIEPGERGSGVTAAAACKDMLDRNWQRLIMSHICECEHPGVLTGSPVTDIRVTLIAGRAHDKHTEGGDFRQATYRAIRQGLKKAKNILLEPYYRFTLDVPAECVGRAMSDVQRMKGSFDAPEASTDGAMARLTGSAPVENMQGYMAEVNAYTKGYGRLSLELSGYAPVDPARQEEIVAAIGYDSESDIDHPTGSVFCAHGAGFSVPWYEVEEYMHVPCGLEGIDHSEDEGGSYGQTYLSQQARAAEAREAARAARHKDAGSAEEQKELEAIFERTYGPVRRRIEAGGTRLGRERPPAAPRESKSTRAMPPLEEYLVVDGYNVIFSWTELKELAHDNLDAARDRLNDVLCDYQGYRQCRLIVVYDAYKRKGGTGSEQDYHNIRQVFTRDGQTADMYIEGFVRSMGKKARVTVVTSDRLEQLTVSSGGALRMSSAEFYEEVMAMKREIREGYLT